MKRLILVLLLVGLAACADDNAEIRARADDTFRYTHWTQHTNQKGMDKAELHFINMETYDAMVYLEQIDKDKCYKNPVTRDMAVGVDCE